MNLWTLKSPSYCGMASTTVLTLLILSLTASLLEAKLAAGECEVCIAVVGKIEKLIADEDRKDPEKLEAKVKKFCKGALNSKENRFCYYLGGTADAATGMLNSLLNPLKSFLPADRICEKLKKVDPQVCELRYEKQIDLDSVDLKKLKVKDLKKILNDWGEQCKACTEKKDFIDRINELRDKHAPPKQEL